MISQQEYINHLVETDTKTSLTDFFKQIHQRFYSEQDVSFMEYFLELTAHDGEFVVHHKKMIEYGIMSSQRSNHVKEKLDSLNLVENEDYSELTYICELRLQGGTSTKKTYMLNPEAFKKCLMRARRYPNQKIDPQIFSNYYLLLEKTYKMYTDYEKQLMKKQQAQQAQQLEQQAQQLEQKDHELRKQELYTNKLKDIVINIKSRQKDQIIYIATTEAYAKQNRFKIGGVKSRGHLKSRLNTYNCGRPVGDKMYYALITETTDYHHLEQRVSKILGDHKDKKEAEMYHVHYDSLKPWIEYLTDNFDKEVQHHRNLFDTLVKETVEKVPTIPDKIVLNGAEFRRIKNGEICFTQKVDFDAMTCDEQKEHVINLFEQFLIFNPTDLTRKDFEEFVYENGTKFSKRNLWLVTKEAAQKFKKMIKY